MSYQLTDWACDQRDMPKPARAVLIEIARCHNWKTGQCNPGIQRLVQKSGYRDRAVQGAITWLLKAGKFKITLGRNGGRGLTQHFEFPEEAFTQIPAKTAPYSAANTPQNTPNTPQNMRGPICTEKGKEPGREERERATPTQPDLILTSGLILVMPPEEPAREPVEIPPPEPAPALGADPAQVLGSENRTASREDPRPPRACPLPDGWQPNPEGRAYAQHHGFDPDVQVVRMANKALANGWIARDWQARFRAWIDDEIGFNPAGKKTRAEKEADLNRGIDDMARDLIEGGFKGLRKGTPLPGWAP